MFDDFTDLTIKSLFCFSILVFLFLLFGGLYAFFIYPNTDEGIKDEQIKTELREKCLEGDMGACEIYRTDYSSSDHDGNNTVIIPMKY